MSGEQKIEGLFAEVNSTPHPAWVLEGMPLCANCRILRLALKESKFFDVKSTVFHWLPNSSYHLPSNDFDCWESLTVDLEKWSRNQNVDEPPSSLLIFAMKGAPPRVAGPTHFTESILSWTNRLCFLFFFFFLPNPYGFINASRQRNQIRPPT